MLEHSSGAMADDLLSKSKLIQYYCMEGKTGTYTKCKKTYLSQIRFLFRGNAIAIHNPTKEMSAVNANTPLLVKFVKWYCFL